MDWDWFFSSLAQSSAAIVGFFGAFIITKILSNQAEYDLKISRSQDLLATARKIESDAAIRAFEWYNNATLKRQLERLENLVKDEGTVDSPEEYYWRLNFSPYLRRDVAIKAITERLDERRRKEEAEALREKTLRHTSMPLPGLASVRALPLDVGRMNIRGYGDWRRLDNINAEREAIDRVGNDALYHARLVSNFLTSTRGDPESSAQITVALLFIAALFYVGVIYPLSFLPSPQPTALQFSLRVFLTELASIRGVLLAAVCLIFTGITAMFARMNWRMKYSRVDLGELEQYQSVGGYSPYFEVAEKNRGDAGSG